MSWDWTGGAELSADRRYRYRLWRELNPCDPTGLLLPRPMPVPPAREGHVCWIMLNPSTADEHADDPTLRKVIGFSERWGFRRIEVVNLFALRATDPRELRKADDPVGDPEGTLAIIQRAQTATRVVVGWGRLPGKWAEPRACEVQRLVGGPLYCLGTTAAGEPRHPLMLAYDEPLRPWPWENR